MSPSSSHMKRWMSLCWLRLGALQHGPSPVAHDAVECGKASAWICAGRQGLSACAPGKHVHACQGICSTLIRDVMAGMSSCAIMHDCIATDAQGGTEADRQSTRRMVSELLDMVMPLLPLEDIQAPKRGHRLQSPLTHTSAAQSAAAAAQARASGALWSLSRDLSRLGETSLA